LTRFQDRQEGERVVDFYMIRDREVKRASNGTDYLNLTLERKLEYIPARLWDATEQHKQALIRRAVVKVDGVVTVYRQQKQLNIQRIRLATDEDPVTVAELISKPGLSREELWHELRMIIEEIQDETLLKLVKTMLGKKEIRERFTTIPASKATHHPYYAGLLEHVVEVCQSILQLSLIYGTINRDVVIAAAILHDIGKVAALHDPFAPEYTDEGEMIGHVVLGVELINQTAQELGISMDEPILLAVKHCILSQREQDEGATSFVYGPKTKEAILLAALDQLNGRLNSFELMASHAEERWTYSPLFKRKMFTPDND
jgi:3'-5' exoribonuclease